MCAPRRPTAEVAALLFTSNLVGLLFARSLHYQFQSWYFHQLPLLVFLSRSRIVSGCVVDPLARLCRFPSADPLPAPRLLLVPIAYGWGTYPSTSASSLALLVANAGLLAGVWLGDAEGRGRRQGGSAPVSSTEAAAKAR